MSLKFIKFHFWFFGILTVIAAIPQGTLWMFIISFPLLGALGFATLAAPTVLLYSTALIPFANATFTADRRSVARIAVAALIPLAIAFGPGLLSLREAGDSAARMSAEDFSRTAASKPSTIELAGDSRSGLWDRQHSIGDESARCNEICQKLLFNGEAESVRMTTMPFGASKGAKSVTYRIEHREVCPEIKDNGNIGTVLRDRLVAGDCLIGMPGSGPAPAAIVKLATLFIDDPWTRARTAVTGRSFLADIESTKRIEIEATPQDNPSLLVRQTETVARPLAMPFYIGANLGFACSSCTGSELGRSKIVTGTIDVAQVLRATFGYAIAEIAPVPAEDPRKVAESLLTLPADTAPSFSAQQQDVISEVLKVIATKPVPSDADMALIGRVIADGRVNDVHVGISIQVISRRNPDKFAMLIPVILHRMVTPVDQRVGHYKAELGWSLQNIPAGILLPYRDKIIAIVESQPDWPSYGLLTRLAELGGDDAIKLVIQWLDIERRRGRSPQEFAAIAMCRGNANTWPLFEPAVVSHLERASSARFGDEDSPLLLTLVRFGKKAEAIELVQKRSNMQFRDHVVERLNTYEPDFDPKHCRDRL